MAGEKDAGSIVYTVSADIEPLLVGGKLAADALDKLDAAAQQSSKGLDGLDQSTSQTGSAFTELAGYQVQDFIIQVQGGQSALVAFA